jgi:transposase-like protein
MKTLLAAVTKAGDRRRKAEAEHKASVDALHEAAQAALDGGVPMARVSDASGISRQWLYKMGEFAGRGENGSGSKPAAKSAVKRATSRQSTKSTQSKRTGTRPRIKSRA